ncbi:MAG: tRNA lysidine(34) synthetase TilS [Vicinamibacterales bacterium]
MSSLRARVRRTIERHDLCPPGTRVLVALSGGSDSTALLTLLHELLPAAGAAIAAVAHVHHRLRDTADRDARFCRELADRFGYPFDLAEVDVRAAARREGWSVEDAARRERYAALEAAAARRGADRIATGHTRDDQVETALMKLARGAGLSGLGGVYPERGAVIRPLLDVSREELRAHLREAGEAWVEDETNEDLSNPRNRVRHLVVPALAEALGDAALDGLARSARQAGEDGRWLDGLALREFERLSRPMPGGASLDRQDLVALPAPLRDRVLLLAMRGRAGRAQIRTEHVHEAHAVALGRLRAAESPAGRWELSGRKLVLLDRPSDAPGVSPVRLLVPGTVEWPGAAAVLTAEAVRDSSPGRPGELAALVATPADRQFAVRSRQPGDVIRLKAGRKKLQDLFVDAKVPRRERDTVPVVTDSNDSVVWVPGLGISEDFRVPPAEGEVILLRFTPKGEQQA